VHKISRESDVCITTERYMHVVTSCKTLKTLPIGEPGRVGYNAIFCS